MFPQWEHFVTILGTRRLLPSWEQCRVPMQILALKALRDFWTKYPAAEKPLRTWYKIVLAARWKKPNEVKQAFGNNVDFVGDNRVIFDIGGNKYRLVTRIVYDPYFRVMIKFVGTHAEYGAIDPETV